MQRISKKISFDHYRSLAYLPFLCSLKKLLMNFWLISIPFISALLGWALIKLGIKMLFHPRLPIKTPVITIQGFFPKRRYEISASIAKLISVEFDSLAIEKKILDPVNLEKIIPEIETYIDHFLRVKLKDAMPMVAMFVGDRTIVQMKEVFMTEMKTLFPVIMENYVNELKKDLDIHAMVTRKLDSLEGTKIELFFLQILARESRYVQVAGALFGFVLGALQIIITLLINP